MPFYFGLTDLISKKALYSYCNSELWGFSYLDILLSYLIFIISVVSFETLLTKYVNTVELHVSLYQFSKDVYITCHVLLLNSPGHHVLMSDSRIIHTCSQHKLHTSVCRERRDYHQ